MGNHAQNMPPSLPTSMVKPSGFTQVKNRKPASSELPSPAGRHMQKFASLSNTVQRLEISPLAALRRTDLDSAPSIHRESEQWWIAEAKRTRGVAVRIRKERDQIGKVLDAERKQSEVDMKTAQKENGRLSSQVLELQNTLK